VRRVPGASLDSFSDGTVVEIRRVPPGGATPGTPPRIGAGTNGRASGRAGTNGANGAGPGARRGAAPATGPIAVVPERPEDVLAWAEDLEAAMARLPDPTSDEGTPESGRAGEPSSEGDDA
jgi:hypothetical protein